MKAAMTLDHASTIAARFVKLIEGACDTVIVAGSIRRRSPTPHDIEIVAVPRWEDRPAGLFAEITQPTNLLDDVLAHMERQGELQRRAAGESQRTAWGPHYKRLTFEGAPFDLFTPEADRLGIILVIRTGPAEWSHQLVTPRGTKTRTGRDGLLPPHLRVQDGWLIYRTSGERIPTPTEQSVFDLCGLRYRAPEDRL